MSLRMITSLVRFLILICSNRMQHRYSWFPALLLALALAGGPWLPASSAASAQAARGAAAARGRVQTTPSGPVAPRPAARPDSRHGNADAITADELKDFLYFIASDEMEGRDTPSRGLDTTAKFLALNLSRWGFRPAGDAGSYFQKIALRKERVDPAGSTATVGRDTFRCGEDFLARPRAGTASAPAVYVGDGWVVKAKGLDAYKGVDVRDRVMIVTGRGWPKGITGADLRGKQGEDWQNPEGYAREHGAKAVVWVPNFDELAGWARTREYLQRESTVVDRFDPAGAGPLEITAGPALVASLFRGEQVGGGVILGRALAGEGGEALALKPDKVVNLTVAVATESLPTQNVVAVLEGSDPVLKNEFVAFGAHYDHLGVHPNGSGDAIYNGADDDGSGTTALLAMADAFAHGPRPKRSLLFVWHCGEEKGLWGSRYFTDNPTVPLDHVVAQLNIDMIGRSKPEGDMNAADRELSGPNEVYVIGSKMMSSELGALSESVNHSYLNLTLNYRYDDPKDPNGFFYRSDHFNYARKGIPIIFYFDGVHQDYHRPSDSPDKIDYQKMEKITRTVFATGWEIANLPERPKVDQPLPAQLRGR